MTNPSLDLEELKQLAAEASPGPWIFRWDELFSATGKTLLASTNVGEGVVEIEADGSLIVAAVNSLPALIAEVERLREERNLRTLLDAESEVAEKTFENVSLPDFSHD